MQYVTEEVAREIERAVKVITTDEKGFLREAALQYIKENAPTDKVEGAKYIFTGDETTAPDGEACYPARGTTGTLTRDDRTESPLFQWESAPPEFPGGEVYNKMSYVRRISSLTAPEQPEPEEKPEPVKLYCVKDGFPIPGRHDLVRGKVYEFDGHRVNYEVTKCFRAKDFEAWKRGDAGYAACLAPLVSRPAKVGEWVYLLSDPYDWDNKGRHQKGDIVLITHFGCLPSVKVDGKTVGFFEHEYLVLDGYDGRYEEQEQPKPNAALADRIKHLETENRLLEAENAKLCAKIAAIRKAVESEE